MVLSFRIVLEILELPNGILREAVNTIYQGALYYQNVLRLYCKIVSVISFELLRKCCLPCTDFHEMREG